MTKVLNEYQKNWLEGLTHKKYVQAKSRLRKEDGFCCLGVACDVVPGMAWGQSFNPYHTAFEMAGTAAGNSDPFGAYLSMHMREVLDLSQAETLDLTVMNDNGKDFAYIRARIIDLYKAKGYSDVPD